MARPPSWRYIGSFHSPNGTVTVGDPTDSDPGTNPYEPSGDDGPWDHLAAALQGGDPPHDLTPLILDLDVGTDPTDPWPGKGAMIGTGDGFYPVYLLPDRTRMVIDLDDLASVREEMRAAGATVEEVDIESGLLWIGVANGVAVEETLEGGDTIHVWVYEANKVGVLMVRISTREEW